MDYTSPRTDYEWIGKTISEKKSDKINKKTENQCKYAAWKQKTFSEKWNFGSNKKLGLKWTMNGLGKPFRKKSDPKNRKNALKNLSEIAECEQKTTSEKATFC